MEHEKEAGFINSAIDFFANIGTGEKLEVDHESNPGIYTPAALHESWERAITDVGVIFMDKGEVLPKDWEIISKTVGDNEANINYGSWKSRQTFICFRRRKQSRQHRQIVDIRISYGSKIPDGYQQISKTISGLYDGSLSRQSSGMYDTYLCVKYAKVEVNGGRVPSPPPSDGQGGASSGMSTTSPNKLLEGQRSGSPPRKRRASGSINREQLYHTERSITELAIVLPGKNERAPGNYVEKSENLNRGIGTSRVLLAVKFGSRLGICDLPLVPTVMDRLPLGSVWVHREGNDDMGGSTGMNKKLDNPMGRRDVFELVFPEAVPMFCFPRGVRLKRSSRYSQPRPSAFSYVFTEDMGRRVFVSCLVFYEPVAPKKVEELAKDYRCVQVFWDGEEEGEDDNDCDEDDERRKSEGTIGTYAVGGGGDTYAEGDDMRIWAPQCLCLMSHWPIYQGLRTSLRHLWSFSMSRCRVPLERHLAVLLATPMPRPGAPPVHLQLDLGLNEATKGEVATLSPVILHQPPLRSLPLMDLDFEMPFHSLSVDRVLAVFGLMLKETPMLFLSASSTRLTESIEALRALLFPLDYKVTYVPRLPDRLSHFLESPMGFIMGMVLDPEEYGSADGASSPRQMVRQLHDLLGDSEGCGIVVVSLDENLLYEAGGSLTTAGKSISEEEESNQGHADDIRLVKEGINGSLPEAGANLLRARLSVLNLKAKPGLLPVKFFDSPFPHVSMDDFDDLDSMASQEVELSDSEKDLQLCGVTSTTVAIRDAFLSLLALTLGHFRSFVRTPSHLLNRRNAKSLKESNHAVKRSVLDEDEEEDRRNDERIRGGGGNGGDSVLLQGVGIDEWFDFPGFITSFSKKDQLFAKKFSETQMFSSLVQQTVEPSEGDVRRLFFDEYCDALATRLSRLPGHNASFSNLSAFGIIGSNGSIRESQVSDSSHGHPGSLSHNNSFEGGGGPSQGNVTKSLTFLLDSSTVLSSASLLPPLIMEMGLGEDAEAYNSTYQYPDSSPSQSPRPSLSRPSPSPARRPSYDSRNSRSSSRARDSPARPMEGVGGANNTTSSPRIGHKVGTKSVSTVARVSSFLFNEPLDTLKPEVTPAAPPVPPPVVPKNDKPVPPPKPDFSQIKDTTSDDTSVITDKVDRLAIDIEDKTMDKPLVVEVDGELEELPIAPVVVREPSPARPHRSALQSKISPIRRLSVGWGVGSSSKHNHRRSESDMSRKSGNALKQTASTPNMRGNNIPRSPRSGGNNTVLNLTSSWSQPPPQRKRVIPGASPSEQEEPEEEVDLRMTMGGTPVKYKFYEYPQGWPRKLNPELFKWTTDQVDNKGFCLPVALIQLRMESALKDRGYNERQLLTRSKGERRRRGSIMMMGTEQKPIHSLVQFLASYLACLPARVSLASSSQRTLLTPMVKKKKSVVQATKAEPVQEVLRALGLLFHLEHRGHAKHLDEATWRALLIGCGKVGGAGMRKVALKVEEAMMKATGRAPNVVTLGQLYLALTGGHDEGASRNNRNKVADSQVGTTGQEYPTWSPPCLLFNSQSSSQPTQDPFLWLELSGIIWCRCRAVEGLWQCLVDRITDSSLQRLLVNRRDPFPAPGRGLFSDLAKSDSPSSRSSIDLMKMNPLSELYPPFEYMTHSSDLARENDLSEKSEAVSEEKSEVVSEGKSEEKKEEEAKDEDEEEEEGTEASLFCRLVGMWSDGPCPFCSRHMLDEEILALHPMNTTGSASSSQQQQQQQASACSTPSPPGSNRSHFGGEGAEVKSFDEHRLKTKSGNIEDGPDPLMVSCPGCSQSFYPTLKLRSYSAFYPSNNSHIKKKKTSSSSSSTTNDASASVDNEKTIQTPLITTAASPHFAKTAKSPTFSDRVRRVSVTGSVVNIAAAAAAAAASAVFASQKSGMELKDVPTDEDSFKQTVAISSENQNSGNSNDDNKEQKKDEHQEENNDEGNEEEDEDECDNGEFEGVVLYLSPAVLRLRIDEVLLEFDATEISAKWLRENRPQEYWNLQWYSSRLGVPLPFPAEKTRIPYSLKEEWKEKNSKKINKDKDGNNDDDEEEEDDKIVSVFRVITGWEENIVSANCHWLLNTASSLPCLKSRQKWAREASQVPVNVNALSMNMDEEEEEEEEAEGGEGGGKTRRVSSVVSESNEPRFSFRSDNKEWQPFSREENDLIATAMKNAAVLGFQGGTVRLPQFDVKTMVSAPTPTPAPATRRRRASYVGSYLEVRWGSDANEGDSTSPTNMLQINLDSGHISIVRRDDHRPSPGGLSAFMDFHDVRSSTTSAPTYTRCGLKSSTKRSMPSFEGGTGVVLPIGAEPRPVTREEVVMLWQPARLPLDYLFPGCSQHLNSMNELEKIKNGLLYGGNGGIRSAIMSHVRHGNRIDYEPGGKRYIVEEARKELEKMKREEEKNNKISEENDDENDEKKDDEKEEEVSIVTSKSSKSAERIGSDDSDSESGSEIGVSSELHEVEALAVNVMDFDDSSDSEDDEGNDHFDRAPCHVFATNSFYRTMVTISGHYDVLTTQPGARDKKGAGLVIGVPNQQMFAKPAYLVPPPAPAAAPVRGFRATMTSSFNSGPTGDVALNAVMTAAQGMHSNTSNRGGKTLRGSPFDDSLRIALGTISVHELRDYDVTNDVELSSSAPPPDAVQFRSVFGHIY